MFQPPPQGGAGGHSPHMPPTIAMGGGSVEPAADGSIPLRRHPEWIKARLPSGENYHDLKRILHLAYSRRRWMSKAFEAVVKVLKEIVDAEKDRADGQWQRLDAHVRPARKAAG